MMFRSIRVPAMAVAAAWSLQGCSDTAYSPDKPVDACTLLSRVEVEETVGLTLQGPSALQTQPGDSRHGGMTSCAFESKPSADKPAGWDMDSWYVTVMVWTWPVEQGAVNYVQAMRDTPLSADPVSAVTGVGDEAVWNKGLHARKGKVSISVDVQPPPYGMSRQVDMEKALMEKALARLR